MKKLLLSFMLIIAFSCNLFGQEKENPRFNLTESHVTSVLELETNPVYSTEIQVYIFTAEDKSVNTKRIVENLTIHRGKAKHDIDIEELPLGKYYIEIAEQGKGSVYKELFIKK